MTLRNKLIILFLLVSLIPFWIIGVGVYFLIEENVLNVSLGLMSEIANRKEDTLLDVLRDDLNNLPSIKAEPRLNSLLDSYPDWTPEDRTEVNQILMQSLSPNSNFQRIYILDQTGAVIGSTDATLIGQDFSDKEFFQRGVRSLTTSVFARNEAGELIRYFASPINIGHQFIGAVVAESDARDFVGTVGDYTGLGETGESYVVRSDQSGNVTFITPTRFDPDAALRRAVPKGIEDSVELAAVYERQTETSRLTDYRGEKVIAAVREISGATPLGNVGFLKLIVKKDFAEVIAPLNRIRTLFFGVTLALTAILLLIALFLIRSAISPIHSLAIAARKISEGDLSQKVSIRSKDEVGQLASIFNVMSSSLSERSLELNKKTEDLKQKVFELDKARLETEQERARDEEILHNIGDGLVVIDSSGEIRLASRRFGQMLSADSDKLIGKEWQDVIYLFGEDGKEIPPDKGPIQRVFDAKARLSTTPITEKNSRLYLLGANNKKMPVQITASPIMAGDRVKAIVVIFRDIAREIETERSKTEFVSVASHKLRTPLSAVNWYLEMIMSDKLENLRPEQLDYLKEIGQGNQRMIDLVDALLNTSRIELGEFSVQPTKVNVNDLIQEVLKEMDKKIAENGLIVEEHYEKNLPEIEADRDLFMIVIKNLISNAVRYANKNIGIEATLQKIDKADFKNVEDEKWMLIKIYDDGIGISEEKREYVFTKLFRADNAKLRDPEGSGLGLYMTKSILDQTGGKIWFESKENEGAAFSILVPINWMSKKLE